MWPSVRIRPVVGSRYLASHAPQPTRYFVIAAGCMLALLGGASHVVVGAHSASEVVAGLVVGGAAIPFRQA